MSTSDQQSLESLAFLFLTFGHSTDGALTMEEMRALASRLQGWAPDADLARLGEIIKATVTSYKAQPDKLAKAKEHCARLKETATADELQRVVSDLAEIAAADGNVSEDERAFIEETASDFGVTVP